MPSLSGAPSFKFLIMSSTSWGPTVTRNIVRDNLSPIYSVGDLFTLAMLLDRVLPIFTKKSLKRSDMIFLSEVIEPSDSLNFSWVLVFFLLFIIPFNIDQVFFKLDLLFSNFSVKYFFSAILEDHLVYSYNVYNRIRFCRLYFQIFHIQFIFLSNWLFESFSEPRLSIAIS